MKERRTLHAKRQNRHLALFVAVAAAFYLLTMPGSYYRGDNFAPRTEAVFLLTTGGLGIPYVQDQARSGFIENRGQYFFENDRRREMFSKYGILNTFLYVPPLWTEETLRGSLPPLPATATLLAFINAFNLIFFLAALLYLYGLAVLYSRKTWVRLTWVFATCFTSFIWFHLRAPALEVYQVPALLAAMFHTINFWRIRRALRGAPPHRAWLNLAAAATACAVAANLKTLFVIVFPIIAVFALCAGNRRIGPTQRIGLNLRHHLLPYALSLALPMTAGICILLWSNWYRFGSVFETGYGQWIAPDGHPVARFGLEFIAPALKDFLLTPGNTNIWMHAPLLLIALCAWRLFLRRHRAEATFIGLTTVALFLGVCSFSVWASGWCYGPRYVIHSVVLAFIPLLFTLDRLPASPRHRQFMVVGVVVIVGALSLALNIAVNSLGYFAAIEVRGQFVNSDDPEIVRYLRTHPHDGQVSLDLLLHHWNIRKFPPMEVAEERYGATRKEDVAALSMVIAREATPDLWFLKLIRARRAGHSWFPTMPQPVGKQ